MSFAAVSDELDYSWSLWNQSVSEFLGNRFQVQVSNVDKPHHATYQTSWFWRIHHSAVISDRSQYNWPLCNWYPGSPGIDFKVQIPKVYKPYYATYQTSWLGKICRFLAVSDSSEYSWPLRNRYPIVTNTNGHFGNGIFGFPGKRFRGTDLEYGHTLSCDITNFMILKDMSFWCGLRSFGIKFASLESTSEFLGFRIRRWTNLSMEIKIKATLVIILGKFLSGFWK